MRYKMDEAAKEPAYLQLYQQVKEDIIKKIYKFGEKLPSKRTVAEETGVSTVTVEHAYSLLSEEGYIEAKERSGYFVSFRTDWAFSSLQAPKEEDSVSLFSESLSQQSHPSFEKEDFIPKSVLQKAIRTVMNASENVFFNRCPGAGTAKLREAISKYLRRSRGMETSADQIIVGAGSEYLYTLLIDLLGRDRRYCIEFPSYKKIAQVYDLSKVSYELLPLGNDGIESKALWNSNGKILHISPYRSFPSGVSASASKRHEYLNWAEKRNAYIIEDDFESEFSVSTKPEETLFSNTTKDNVLYLNTFSKTISPGLRVGYAVLPKHLVPVYTEKLGFYSSTVSTFVQTVLAELISSGEFERHINRVRRNKRKQIQQNKEKE